MCICKPTLEDRTRADDERGVPKAKRFQFGEIYL